MPTTVNGIGTHYYGKKNLETRTDLCEHCNQEAELRTYDTRLWVVVLFIPVIPLGRKKIIDECALCTYHRALPLDEWERLRKESIGEGMAKVSDAPDDPAAAIELLGTFAAFRQTKEAERLAEIMEQRFPDHAEVQVELGAYHMDRSNVEKARTCFEKAHQLDPEDLKVRTAVGVARLQSGDLDAARESLAFMEQPGPEQNAGLLGTLGDAYQEKGDHETALHFYGLVLQAAPDAGKDRDFRKAVKRSEKALARTESILPRKSWF